MGQEEEDKIMTQSVTIAIHQALAVVVLHSHLKFSFNEL